MRTSPRGIAFSATRSCSARSARCSSPVVSSRSSRPHPRRTFRRRSGAAWWRSRSFSPGGFAFYALYSPPGFHESRGALDGYVEHVITEAEAADGVYDERFDPELRLGSVEVKRVVYSEDWDDVEIVFYDTDCFIGPCGWVYRSAGEPTSVRDAVPLGAGWFDFGR